MQYMVTKTIKKRLEATSVQETLVEKFTLAGACRLTDDGLEVIGFNKQLGGINYLVTATFSISNRGDKTIITANVMQRPTPLFFILLGVLIFAAGIGAIIPVGFYYYGKSLVTQAIQKGLDEAAEELA